MKPLNLMMIVMACMFIFGACSNAPLEGTKIGNPTINVPDTQQAAETQKYLAANPEWEAVVTGCGEDRYLVKFDTTAMTVKVTAIAEDVSETMNYTVNADGSLIAENDTYVVKGALNEYGAVALSIEVKGCGETTPLTVFILIPSPQSIYISTPPPSNEENEEEGQGSEEKPGNVTEFLSTPMVMNSAMVEYMLQANERERESQATKIELVDPRLDPEVKTDNIKE